MRYTTLSAISLSCLILAGCDKGPSVATTAPDIRFAQTPPGPCSAALDRAISQQQTAMFSRAVLTAARNAWAHVVADSVSNPNQAKEEMLGYVQFVINAYRGGNVDAPRVGTREDAVLTNTNSVFTYVGYPAPNLPVSVLGSEGAIGVITQTTVNRELAAANAALTLPVQLATGDQRGHLFSIYPLGAGCLTGTNLAQTGPCFQVSANPEVDPKFDPKIKVGICQPVHANEPIPANIPALAHLHGGVTKVTESAGIYPVCVDLAFNTGSWTNGFGGVARRLAWLTRRAIGIQTAYAAHGGLGGLGDFISPFGAVDALLFKGTFTADAIGSTPVNADVGTWTTQITAPGSISVESSLGDLTSKPVVLSQAGGNCETCGGLLMQGNLTSAGPLATDGRYHVEWTSVQDAPAVKGAPFVLRSSAGAEIARVTYSTVSSANVLSYNGTVFGTWVRHVSQHFEIEVDLNAKTTSLTVDGVAVATGSFTAANFATVSADYRGIDSGVMGWDNISVTRLSDQ
jgi:hypothetical protein